jgi:hypothetical protein
MNEEADKYIINGLEYARVTKVLADVGIIDSKWFDEYAAIRGTYVHEATALFDRKDLDVRSVDQRLEGYVKAWIRFRMDNPDIEIVDTEKKLYSVRLRAAGRLDVLARKGGRLGIIDKKAATTLNPSVEIQTAAYENLYREMTGYTGAMWRKAVQLFPDGTYKAKSLEDSNDLNIWTSAINIVNWKKKRR